MNLKELAFPIRIYWDLTPFPENISLNYKRICEDILEMKFFTLNLRDTGPQVSGSSIEILERLKNEMISVALTISPQAFNSLVVSQLADLKVKELLVASSYDTDLLKVAELIQQHKDKGITIGVSFEVHEKNYGDIPDILSICLDNGISRLVFPMQRVREDEPCFYITAEEGKTLAGKLSEYDLERMKITIHDPFLWRIFYPSISFPGGGCQAANSMVSITPEGKVYPCPAMPISLGSLNEHSLQTILSSDYKREVRKSLCKAPEECLNCEELRGCMGGCRGRVHVLMKVLDQRDPACIE